jgi:hypothetical protein
MGAVQSFRKRDSSRFHPYNQHNWFNCHDWHNPTGPTTRKDNASCQKSALGGIKFGYHSAHREHIADSDAVAR